MTVVGILGGTGPAGRGVAVRLAAGGHRIILGSRDPARAAAAAGALAQVVGDSVRGASNEEAAHADLVVVATPWESTLVTVRALRESLADKVVISMVNALAKDGSELVPLTLPRGSVTAHVAAALRASRVVGAFHHLPAAQMEDLASGLESDVLIVGDDAAARQAVVELVHTAPGLRPVEVGGLALAGAVEAFTAVCITVNIRHRAHAAVRLTGLG